MVKITKPHTCKAKEAMAAKLAALQGNEVTLEYSLCQLTGSRDFTIQAPCHPIKLAGLFSESKTFLSGFSLTKSHSSNFNLIQDRHFAR